MSNTAETKEKTKTKIETDIGKVAQPQEQDVPLDSLSAMSGAAGINNVERIRDILFGGQMRDYEKRFNRLEEKMSKEVTRLRADMDKRMSSLEDFMRREFETLSEKLQAEKKERSESNLILETTFKAADASLKDHLSEVEEYSTKELRRLQHQQREDAKNSENSVNELRTELIETLERELNNLRDSKLDRTALAALFTETAMRLNDDAD